MNISLPVAIGASMPTQYVQYLDDSNIASMETVPEIQGHTIDVAVEESHLLWQYGNKRLRVNVAALEQASLSIGTFGPNELIFFTLHFGDPDGGGVRMLHAPIADGDSYREIIGTLEKVLPCRIQDFTNGNR